MGSGRCAVFFEKVSKSFVGRGSESRPVLRGLDFCVPWGKLTSVLGTTACGKSTLLRIAAGLLEPDCGVVTFAAVSGEVGAQKKTGAFMPQQNTLFPWLNLLDNTLLPHRLGRRYKRGESTVCALEALARVGLAGRERAWPYECSGGMRQRAMLARMLLSDSSVWLLDEPFSALDVGTRHALQELLLELQRERGLTILSVTHDIEEAVYLSDKILILGAGGAGHLKELWAEASFGRVRGSVEFTAEVERVFHEFQLLSL